MITKEDPLCTQLELTIEHFLINCVALPEKRRGLRLFSGWTLKNILSHLIEWNKVTISTVEGFLQGQDPIWIEDENKFNADAVNRWKQEKLSIVLLSFISSSTQLINAYESVPMDKRDIPLSGSESATINNLILIDVSHYKEHSMKIFHHLSTIRRVLD